MAFFAAPLALGVGGGLGSIGTVFSMLGTVVSAMGTIAAGKAQAAQANAAAAMNERNAQQAEDRAEWERAQHRLRADLAKKKKVHAISAAQAAGATSGFSWGDHTSSIAIENLERWGSYDEFMELAGGEMAYRDGIVLRDSHRFEAKLNRMEAGAASSSAMIGAAGTIAGGFGSLFSKFNPPTGQGVAATSTSGLMPSTASHFYSSKFSNRPG